MNMDLLSVTSEHFLYIPGKTLLLSLRVVRSTGIRQINNNFKGLCFSFLCGVGTEPQCLQATKRKETIDVNRHHSFQFCLNVHELKFNTILLLSYMHDTFRFQAE